MPERYELQKELDLLHKDITKMGAMVEKAYEDMVEAFVTQNVDLAKEIIENDKDINDIEVKIERECILLIARQQPIATDLRDIASVMNIITDLERIGDNCVGVSRLIISLSEKKYFKPLVQINEMLYKVGNMVKSSIDSCVHKDIELAKTIRNKDLEVNEYFHGIVLELVEIMKDKPEAVEQCKDYMFIVKYLERTGDHAKNIAEWVNFIVTGKHGKKPLNF